MDLDLIAVDSDGVGSRTTTSDTILPGEVIWYKLDYSSTTGDPSPLTRLVNIDIKPGGGPNSILCTNDREIIPVAILITDTFDALTVNQTTVTFE